MGTPQIIVVRETAIQSLVKDAGTFVMIIALIGVGVVLDSVPMQWLGAGMWLFGVIGHAAMRRHTLTIVEARRRLDEIEREIAQ